jgi:hypothetical protein
VSAAGGSDSDTVDVVVKHVNHAPVARAGEDQTVREGSPVTLSGAASFDPDGDALTYQWTQTGGTPVTLDDPAAPEPTFTAPFLPGGATGSASLTFSLTVSDGALSSAATVSILVEQVDHAPTADAGSPLTVNAGTLVILDGTASSDPDGDPLAYQWTQVAGPAVSLANGATATPSFGAPAVAGPTALVFRLTVSDSLLVSEPDDVTVTVVRPNDPPLCALAAAKPNLLWPPNHRMKQVRIKRVADPNNDAVVITIQGVTQDEPVNGLGDGDTRPDALIKGRKLFLRAERSGEGNGRVYQIRFTADDGHGGTCSGTANVRVPLKKPQQSVIDDGQFYDSTQP